MVSGDVEDTIELRFARIRVDGQLQRPFDAVLRVVADFYITLNGVEVHRESEFCVVEFGAQLARWLIHGIKEESDFVYTSEESEIVGLVTFRQENLGRWSVSVFDLQRGQRRTLSTVLSSEGIHVAIRDYARRLLDELPDRARVLHLLEEEGEHDVLTLFRAVDGHGRPVP